jgi:hypothetical protein
MSAASNYLEDKLLDHVLRYGTAPYTGKSTVYVALFADAGTPVLSGANGPLESGTSGTASSSDWGYYEIQTTGSTSYARQSISFGAAGAPGGNTTGTIKNSTTVSFPVAGANYDTLGGTGNVVTHIAIMDESTGGNVLFYGQLTTSKTVSAGDQFTISAGNLSISLA